MANYSESYRVQTVLVQPPLDVQPLAMALFMEANEPYRPRLAQAEIYALIEKLTEHGMEVVTFKQTLLQGNVEELRDLTLSNIGCADEMRMEMVRGIIEQMQPDDLVELLFQRPSLRLVPDPELSKISPDAYYEEYQISPLFGLMFPRDHFIITNRGMILGNFRRKDRRHETPVVKLALKNLGILPVYEFRGDAYLEGGDFTTTGTVSFIANGMRTNTETIQEMLQQDLFGTPWVVEMVDLLREPEEFHLDHYFNIVDEEFVAISEERLQSEHLRCHVYEKQKSSYVRVAEGLTFMELADRLSMRVLAVPKIAESKMGVNFLNIGERRLLCTENMPQSVVDELVMAGYVVERMEFYEMHKQYGSLHCSTQTIRRVPVHEHASV